jgi:hypothetical protein
MGKKKGPAMDLDDPEELLNAEEQPPAGAAQNEGEQPQQAKQARGKKKKDTKGKGKKGWPHLCGFTHSLHFVQASSA